MDENILGIELILDPDGYSRSILDMACQRFRYSMRVEDPTQSEYARFIGNDYKVWRKFFFKRP